MFSKITTIPEDDDWYIRQSMCEHIIPTAAKAVMASHVCVRVAIYYLSASLIWQLGEMEVNFSQFSMENYQKPTTENI